MRDYQEESKDIPTKKYSYNFDEYMRGAMIKAWRPFFVRFSALEVGSGNGELTEYLMSEFFNSELIDCIDPLINTTLENYKSDCKYDNIIMHNVLEHMDDPILALTKARDLLTGYGRVFISVPNANAPSRQIAVKMGIIEHTQSVTKDEYMHGHRRTYNLETICKEIKDSGLKILKSGGVFFKPLANFQLDAALEKGIITPEYMDGCLQMGEHYPELCASIYVIAE